MRKAMTIFTAAALAAGMMPSFSAAAASASGWSYGLNGAKGFNEDTYSTISRNTTGTTNSNWRDGSMTGNGEMSVIESCDPDEDVIIYNNTKLVLGTNDIFDIADVSGNIDSIRKTAADRTNPGAWTGWVQNYWKDQLGASGHLSSNTKSYHPAAQLRIKNNIYSSYDSYNRYTNFESAEVGMQWKKGGAEYNSRTFVSRKDGVAVTVIEAPTGENLDLTLSIDNLLEMGIDSIAMIDRGIEIIPQSREIVKSDSKGYNFGQIVKYGDYNVKGSDSNPDAYGAKGGYATAIRLLTGEGATVTQSTDNHSITAHQFFNTADKTAKLAADISTPKLNVTGTNSIMLVSKVDQQLTGLADLDAVETLYDSLVTDVDNVIDSYGGFVSETAATPAPGVVVRDGGKASTVVANTTGADKEYMLVSAAYDEDGRLTSAATDKKSVAAGESETFSVADKDKVFLWDTSLVPYIYVPLSETKTSADTAALYSAMLAPHKTLHYAQFEGTELTLAKTVDEIADRSLTNSELNKKQQGQSGINKAWLERLYDNARFGLICASGYNTSRLGGIWVGNWMPDWSGDFTQDANVNLQVSAVNTTGLKDAAQSYITYILRQVSDWETNAKKVYGIDNAIMAGPRTDGDGNGLIYHTLAGYPFLYWNTGADWLLIPIYEYWQCYGNETIPLGDDVDQNELAGVLDLNSSDIARIAANGFDLEGDILAPLMTKLYNFWQGYTSDKFYISADGTTMHLNDGTTMGDTDKFMFSPGYSPENVPNAAGSGYNQAPSLAANTTMDISAAHDSMSMVKALISSGVISGITTEAVDAFESKFPTYLYGEDGALKEWAVASYEEHYNHRHVSHTYSAWPAYEAHNDAALKAGLATALDMRYTYNVSDNAQAHGHLHNGLVEARIGRKAEYEKCLHTLIAANYEYAALMTSHNRGHGSAFCTDNAFGLMGVVTEALLYSNTGEIELLPTLVDSFTEGEITHLMARTNAEVESLSWDSEKVTAKITSSKANNKIRLSCGEAWSGATVNGSATTTLTDSNGAYVELTLGSGESATVVFTRSAVANGTYYIKNSDGTYLGVTSYAEGAATTSTATPEKWNIKVNANGTYTIVNTYSGRVLTTNNTIVRGSTDTWFDLSGFTLEKQATQTAGCVADVITISTDADLTGELNSGKSVQFAVSSYTPGAAVSYGVNWYVEAADGAALTTTKISNDGKLTISTDALGKTLNVYAKSPDGSCTSNVINVNVAEVETETVKVEMESFTYGFGDYKNEGTAIGTIAGKTVIKFADVDMDALTAVEFYKSNTNPSKTTLYTDLTENTLSYYDSYSRNSGNGTGAASKRYTIDGVTIDASKAISDTVSVANGTDTVHLDINDGVSGTHDLYVVIETNGATWAGNYDYMNLIYVLDSASKTLSYSDFAYGFGNFKLESDSIGSMNNTAYIKYANVDFNGLRSITYNRKTDSNACKVTMYYDLTENKPLTYYDNFQNSTGESSRRYTSAGVTEIAANAITATEAMDASTYSSQLELTKALTGTHDLYIKIEGNGTNWRGNLTSIELNYKGRAVSERTEFESFKYGFADGGVYKIDTRTAANNAGNCSNGSRVHNIGQGGTQYFVFENVDFADAIGMLINAQSSNATPITVYVDYSDAANMTISNTDTIAANTNSADKPRVASAVPDFTNAVKIAEGTISTASGYNDNTLEATSSFPTSGTHNVCIVMGGSGWKGDYDYFEIQKLKR